jgi:hypothetical protein
VPCPALRAEVDVSQWRESAAILLSNRPKTSSAALCRLGDKLRENGLRDPAHFWYITIPIPIAVA